MIGVEFPKITFTCYFFASDHLWMFRVCVVLFLLSFSLGFFWVFLKWEREKREEWNESENEWMGVMKWTRTAETPTFKIVERTKEFYEREVRERQHKPTPCPIMEGPPAKSWTEPTIRASSSLTGVRYWDALGLIRSASAGARQIGRMKRVTPGTWHNRVELQDQWWGDNSIVRWILLETKQ